MANEKTLNTLKELAQEVVHLYQRQLNDDGKNASNRLSDSVQAYVEVEGSSYVVYLELEDYWKWVENGTYPHFPPISKIEEWVKIKPVVPSTVNGKVPSTKQLAFAIANKIAKNGTRGSLSLHRALESKDMDNVIERMIEAIREDFIEEINIEINKLYKL